MHKHIEPLGGWVTTAKDYRRSHSFQTRTGIWGYEGHTKNIPKFKVTDIILFPNSNVWYDFFSHSGCVNICLQMFIEIHTLLGNAQGLPCALPFMYSGKWYWDCTSEGREDQHLWCAATSSYDQDQKWGFCPTEGTQLDMTHVHGQFGDMDISMTLRGCVLCSIRII